MTTLEAVLERIVAVAKPDRVILFGSAARGTAGPHSDLDFLVIKHGVTSRRRLAQTIYRALVGIRASIDVVVVTPEDVESLKDGVGTIVGPAMREGRECMPPEGGRLGDPHEWLRRCVERGAISLGRRRAR
jgi:predicted nucleotidyltransferase